MENIDFDKIDAYLLNELDNNESDNFEDYIKKNPSLSKEIDVQKYIISELNLIGENSFKKSILEVEEELDQTGFFATQEEKKLLDGINSIGEKSFKNTIKDIEVQLEKEHIFEQPNNIKSLEQKNNSPFLNRRILSIAAFFLILFTTTWYLFPNAESNQDLYAEFYVNPSDNLSNQVKDEIEEIGFSTEKDEGLILLENIMKLYGSKNYQEYISQSNPLLSKSSLKHYKDELHFYRAIAMMESNLFDAAENEFKVIGLYNDEMNWYRALNFVQLGKLTEARQLLNERKKDELGQRLLGHLNN